MSYLLCDFRIPVQQLVPFSCDNKAAVQITANPVFTKRLDIYCHLVRDQFKSGFIAPSHIYGPDQPANLFTKALFCARLHSFIVQVGLRFPNSILRRG
ncbi:UNVERIFIED_CONTAM: hypothetical protein Slati_3956600 [Sesamum latifolium]|uniref:Uncharacterized protein n=1 Tax=Sesamum latifolium TaxID=2727402 RepID=A0AAW2TNW6_9LAMI